jgi:hypothetical protein
MANGTLKISPEAVITLISATISSPEDERMTIEADCPNPFHWSITSSPQRTVSGTTHSETGSVTISV